MPLSDTLVQTQPRAIGNDLIVGANNSPYRGTVSLEQWRNRPLTLQDYYAGSVQFMALITFVVTIDPLADLGVVQANPNRTRYGEFCIQNLNQEVTDSYFLQYERQQIRYLYPTINLPRQESSRQKQYDLLERPRFLLSSSAVQDFGISGQIQTTIADYSGTGTIIGATPATFTTNGTATTRGGNVPPTLRVPQRGFRMDVTDARIAFTDRGTLNSYYTFDSYNENLERWLPSFGSIYLQPGVTGTVQVSYVKMNETGTLGANPFPSYVSSSTFPPL